MGFKNLKDKKNLNLQFTTQTRPVLHRRVKYEEQEAFEKYSSLRLHMLDKK